MTWFIDPELRRTLLTEIAFQRAERGRFRRGGEPAKAAGCNRAIRALRDVWMAEAYNERKRTENWLAAS